VLPSSATERSAHSRLSCQVCITADLQGLVVRLPERQQ
jgi:ferredoxin